MKLKFERYTLIQAQKKDCYSLIDSRIRDVHQKIVCGAATIGFLYATISKRHIFIIKTDHRYGW